MPYSLEKQLKLFEPHRFEELCAQLVEKDFPDSQHVDGAGGDEGIDIFAGEINKEKRKQTSSTLHVWQVKFFPDGVKSNQRKKIKESLERVVKIHEPKYWTLCIPVNLDIEGHKWFQSLRNNYPEIIFDCWQADKIVSRMRQDNSLLNNYFQNSKTDAISNSDNGYIKMSIISDYIKLLKIRINIIPHELYEVLEPKPEPCTADFIQLMYIQQYFISDEESGRPQKKMIDVDTLLISDDKHIIIVGGAGSGKTTTLKYLIYKLCNDIIDNQHNGTNSKPKTSPLIPIYIKLGDIQKQLKEWMESQEDVNFKNILNLLVPDYSSEKELFNVLLRYIEEGNTCIVFDGLDEFNENYRKKLLTMIEILSQSYVSRIIITTRDHDYSCLPTFKVYRIKIFDPNQICDFIVRWFESDICALGGTIDDRRLFAWLLFNKIKDGNLIEFVRNPLILAQVVILHKNQEDLKSLSNLLVIKKILKLILIRWKSGLYYLYESFRKLREDAKISDEQILRIFGSVAFHLLKANSDILKHHVITWILDCLDTMEIKNEQAPGIILDYLQNCNGLLNVSNKEPKKYSFTNRKIQEYLAAYYLTQNTSYLKELPDFLKDYQDCWSGVTSFVFDLLDPSVAIIFVDFIRRTTFSNTEKILLVGEIVKSLRDKGYDFNNLYPDILKELKLNTQSIVDNLNVEWSQAVKAGNILGSLGDKRSSYDNFFQPNYWIEIDNSDFEMGYSKEKHSVRLERFYIAKYPVTNEQFNEFVAMTTDRRVLSNWNLEKQPHLYKKNYPVTGLHWREALDFTKWLNQFLHDKSLGINVANFIVRLPTEAEWEKAALKFGNKKKLLQVFDKNKQFLCDHKIWSIGLACVHENETRIYDMFNYVWEWTISSYKTYPYKDDNKWNDPVENQPKVIRGGYSPMGEVEFLRTYRGQCHMYRPVYWLNNVGFRLVLGREIK